MSLNQNLEDTIAGNRPPQFKSEGERKIAKFLQKNSIKYHYEPGVLVNSVYEKPRIWYPDFYLPEFGTYIEYYGLAGRQNYDRGINVKESTYSKIGLAVIPVYPWTFAENWQRYIMKELEKITVQRFRALKVKPYWTQTQNHHRNYLQRRYKTCSTKQY